MNNQTHSPTGSERATSSRIGLSFFAIYLALYAGFVLLNAFAPERMEVVAVAGLNLAVVYGFALIVGAIVLSGLYGLLCRDDRAGNEGKSA